MLTKGEEYVDRGQDYYEQLYRQRVVTNLQRRANELGFTLTPNLQTA
jgi:transposase